MAVARGMLQPLSFELSEPTIFYSPSQPCCQGASNLEFHQLSCSWTSTFWAHIGPQPCLQEHPHHSLVNLAHSATRTRLVLFSVHICACACGVASWPVATPAFCAKDTNYISSPLPHPNHRPPPVLLASSAASLLWCVWLPKPLDSTAPIPRPWNL